MNWDDIRYFLAVARSGSVAQAAEHLEVNYTTVARRITALEEKLAVRLFDRTQSGHHMTDASRLVYEHAIVMELEMADIDRTIYGQDARLAGRLRIATADVIATHLIFPHMTRFQQQYPEIEIEIAVSNTVVDLKRREADIALRIIFGEPPQDMICTHLADLDFAVYASTTYLAQHGSQAGAVITLLQWLPDHDEPVLPEPFRADWIRQLLPDAILGAKIDALPVMVSAIQHDMGVCGLPCIVGDTEPGMQRVVESSYSPALPLWLVHHPDLRATSRVRVFREFIKKILKQ